MIAAKRLFTSFALSCAILGGGSLSALAQEKWSGIYIGGHLGAAWADTTWANISLTGESEKFSPTALIGGGHVGAQKQFGNLVAGVELSYSGLGSDETVASVASPTVSYATKASDLFMVAGRLGWAADNYLLYVKGGYANADLEYSGSAPVLPDAFKQSKRQGGYVIGGGVEYLLGNNLMIGVEYNHVSLGEQTLSGTTSLSIPYILTRAETDIDTVMARLSYKFGARQETAAPLK